MDELKPCPLCGGKVEWEYIRDDGIGEIRCHQCQLVIEDSRDTAEKKWNTRMEKVDEMEFEGYSLSPSNSP
jgi:transcription initiation factor TFIIIB Brf1 subunit/transcription initiation factor TFIIB